MISLPPAKLSVFSLVAGILQPFLVKYQTADPMIPYLYTDLFNIIKKIINLTVNPDIMIKCIDIADLKKCRSVQQM